MKEFLAIAVPVLTIISLISKHYLDDKKIPQISACVNVTGNTGKDQKFDNHGLINCGVIIKQSTILK